MKYIQHTRSSATSTRHVISILFFSLVTGSSLYCSCAFPTPVIPSISSSQQYHHRLRQSYLSNNPLQHTFALDAFSNNNNKNYNYDDDDDGLKEDWKSLTKAASNIARKVGSKALDALENGSSKVADLVLKGVDWVKQTALRNDMDGLSNGINLGKQNRMIVDTDDEALFRGIFGDMEVSVPASIDSIDRVVDQAASLLQKDQVAASLLGSSLRYDRPFSQSRRTTSINGQTTSTMQVTFNVRGNKGQGVVLVSSVNGNISSLDLQVQGRLYRYNNVAAAAAKQLRNKNSKSMSGNDINVEILDGIRRPAASRDDILDADIEDKRNIY